MLLESYLKATWAKVGSWWRASGMFVEGELKVGGGLVESSWRGSES